ncbi:MAG: hypothetical protein AAF587_33805 [Bacteroidota bacterium]
MRYKFTKILVLLVCWLCAIQAQGQSFIVDPGSIQLESTASNWQTAVINGFVLSGNIGLSFYRVAIPPLEVGLPLYKGPDDDHDWIMNRDAVKQIA